jgi:hypothetical protein
METSGCLLLHSCLHLPYQKQTHHQRQRLQHLRRRRQPRSTLKGLLFDEGGGHLKHRKQDNGECRCDSNNKNSNTNANDNINYTNNLNLNGNANNKDNTVNSTTNNTCNNHDY